VHSHPHPRCSCPWTPSCNTPPPVCPYDISQTPPPSGLLCCQYAPELKRVNPTRAVAWSAAIRTTLLCAVPVRPGSLSLAVLATLVRPSSGACAAPKQRGQRRVARSLMHYAEKASKGTGVQAALLAPQHVRVHRLRRGNEHALQVYPKGEAGAQAAAEGGADGAVGGQGRMDPPLQFDPQTDVVLFPGPGAKTAAELKAEGKTPRRVIIIDSSVRPAAMPQRPLSD
jgi:hypothetical protein